MTPLFVYDNDKMTSLTLEAFYNLRLLSWFKTYLHDFLRKLASIQLTADGQPITEMWDLLMILTKLRKPKNWVGFRTVNPTKTEVKRKKITYFNLLR